VASVIAAACRCAVSAPAPMPAPARVRARRHAAGKKVIRPETEYEEINHGKSTSNSAARRVSKKVRKNVADGIAHVHASFNNTIITITDRQGNALSWASVGWSGLQGFAQVARPSLPRWLPKWLVVLAQEQGIKNLDVEIKGPGPGRESSVRALASLGIRINSISDVTPVPHNGCRPQKRRRI